MDDIKLKPGEDLINRSTKDIIDILVNYRRLTAIEIAVILAELKLRE